jgi:hypothetical protein
LFQLQLSVVFSASHSRSISASGSACTSGRARSAWSEERLSHTHNYTHTNKQNRWDTCNNS